MRVQGSASAPRDADDRASNRMVTSCGRHCVALLWTQTVPNRGRTWQHPRTGGPLRRPALLAPSLGNSRSVSRERADRIRFRCPPHTDPHHALAMQPHVHQGREPTGVVVALLSGDRGGRGSNQIFRSARSLFHYQIPRNPNPRRTAMTGPLPRMVREWCEDLGGIVVGELL
jgi:hypothetical protein